MLSAYIRVVILTMLFLLNFPVQAQMQPPPLRVALVSFEPPFVMQASANHFFGFDVDLMEAVCKRLGRDCRYRVMRFDDLLLAVNNNQVDVAVSGITVTLERHRLVDFSRPYLMSSSRFLMRANAKKGAFDFSELNNKTIGVEKGTIFEKQLRAMGLKDSKLITYEHASALVDALGEGAVDYILVDSPSAEFWREQSSGKLITRGQPISYGLGYAIAVGLDNKELLSAINKALLDYQQSKAYQLSFKKYISDTLEDADRRQ